MYTIIDIAMIKLRHIKGVCTKLIVQEISGDAFDMELATYQCSNLAIFPAYPRQ